MAYNILSKNHINLEEIMSNNGGVQFCYPFLLVERNQWSPSSVWLDTQFW